LLLFAMVFRMGTGTSSSTTFTPRRRRTDSSVTRLSRHFKCRNRHRLLCSQLGLAGSSGADAEEGRVEEQQGPVMRTTYQPDRLEIATNAGAPRGGRHDVPAAMTLIPRG